MRMGDGMLLRSVALSVNRPVASERQEMIPPSRVLTSQCYCPHSAVSPECERRGSKTPMTGSQKGFICGTLDGAFLLLGEHCHANAANCPQGASLIGAVIPTSVGTSSVRYGRWNVPFVKNA